MKVELDNITLGYSPLTDSIFAGITNKAKNMWLKKVNVTDSFIGSVIARWGNKTETVHCGKDKWQITVKKLK